MKNIRIKISSSELEYAAHVAIKRRILALENNRKEVIGERGSGWDNNVEGTIAELAVAKWTGKYWHALVDNFIDLPGDVGNWQVRGTPYRNGGLITHRTDKDKSPYLLVTIALGKITECCIVGWMFGEETKVGSESGKDEDGKYWNTTLLKRPAFLVPQEDLHDFDLLDFHMDMRKQEEKALN